jgi:transcriptional regulator with XRE-family HTH domain
MSLRDIGPRIKRARQRRGLTQAALANKVGVSSIHITMIELGTRRPTLGTLERIAKALRVKMVDLLK